MDIQYLYCVYANWVDTNPNDVSSICSLVAYLLYVLWCRYYYNRLIATNKNFIQKVKCFSINKNGL